MMIFIASVGYSILAYCIMALLIFGDLLSPLGFTTVFSNRLGAPFWQILVFASAVAAILCAPIAQRRLGLGTQYRASTFICLWMCMSVLSVGIYAELSRYRKMRELTPDQYSWHSFFRSIREVPRDYQFFYHAVAIKDCRPYAWSYREMAFYELNPNVAINLLPSDWTQKCALERTPR